VDTFLNEMSSSQLAEWLDYIEVNPPMTARLVDSHMSQLLSMFYNNKRSNGAQSLTAADFSLLKKLPEREQSPEDMYQLMKGMQSVQQNS
jgi:hypothetical protein